jgi:Uncharacterized protein conserved in bacteria (DUF2252)
VCALVLLVDADGNPLLLQVKEARASVHEPFAGPQPFETHGERVVGGQRAMQASSDPLLGWADVDDRCVYVRQYRDMKAAPDLAAFDADELQDFAGHCAWALASYVGRSDTFVNAIVAFAQAYAEQTERDHAAFVARFGTPA